MIFGTPFVLDDFEAAWPRIQRRMARTMAPPGALARIRLKCEDGSAMCLSCPDGVVVLTLTQSGSTIRLEVMLAVSVGGPGAFLRHEPSMVRFARELGASRLAFHTDRKGWARLLGSHWTRREDGSFDRSV